MRWVFTHVLQKNQNDRVGHKDQFCYSLSGLKLNIHSGKDVSKFCKVFKFAALFDLKIEI